MATAPDHQWEPYCLTVCNAALMVDKSPQVLQDAIRRGDLPAHIPTGQKGYVILTEDLKRWVHGGNAEGDQ